MRGYMNDVSLRDYPPFPEKCVSILDNVLGSPITVSIRGEQRWVSAEALLARNNFNRFGADAPDLRDFLGEWTSATWRYLPEELKIVGGFVVIAA